MNEPNPESPSWRVGRLCIRRPVMLAPMEGHTDAAFRRVCRSLGADLAFTEFTPWQLLRGSRGRRKIRIHDDERPTGIQLYGREPARMAEAARLAWAEQPDLLDLNFGCPAKASRGGGCGSQLMREPGLLLEVVRAVVAVSEGPVTCKLRLGWDDASINVVELARHLEELGVAGLTVHGRTRCQKYEGRADWEWIARVVEAVELPVVGNGDVASAEDALRLQRESGVAGIMIGRAALRDPWIFARVRAALDGREPPPPPLFGERLSRCREHLARSLEAHGPVRGLRRMRSRYAIYLAGHPDFEALRRELVRLDAPDAVRERLAGLALPEEPVHGRASTAPVHPATHSRAPDISRGRVSA